MTNHPTQEPDYIDKMIKAHNLKDTERHMEQGLQDMTLDLTKYSADALAELQTRIEEEKKKRERKVPFSIDYYDPKNLNLTSENCSVMLNLRHRLSAEAKLRAAGGGEFKDLVKKRYLSKNPEGKVTSYGAAWAAQGNIYFENHEQALSAYATLTPDEKAAIFGFGEG